MDRGPSYFRENAAEDLRQPQGRFRRHASCMRLYLRRMSRRRSSGRAWATRPLMPLVVVAMHRALTMASCVASTVAVNRGFIRAWFSVSTLNRSPELSSLFAVEKATKISPEPSAAVLPVMPTPSPARRASRLHWSASRGASVATTTMMEPSP